MESALFPQKKDSLPVSHIPMLSHRMGKPLDRQTRPLYLLLKQMVQWKPGQYQLKKSVSGCRPIIARKMQSLEWRKGKSVLPP